MKDTKGHRGWRAPKELGDFTTTPRVIPITMLAIGIGVLSAYVALALLRMIALFTNLFFYRRWSTEMISPAGNHLGVWEVLVPVAGATIIGFMARYGSERIRGHGIPEAIESILLRGSRVEPRRHFSNHCRRRSRSDREGHSGPRDRSS
jgi:CIC family chloride channel protein